MSYHNGSIWPHDNALVAAGFSRYGDTVRAAQVLTALFDASRIEAWGRRLMLRCAVLPPWLQRLEIRGLRVAHARVDLPVNRGHFGAAVEVMDRRATSTSSSASDQIGDDLQRFRPTGSGLRRTWRSPAATWCSTRSGSSMAVSTPP